LDFALVFGNEPVQQVERKPANSALLRLFLSNCIQKVTIQSQNVLAKNRILIFVTIINGRHTADKHLIADNLSCRLPSFVVYANKQKEEKYKKQPMLFLMRLVVYSAAFTFIVALKRSFIMRKINELT